MASGQLQLFGGDSNQMRSFAYPRLGLRKVLTISFSGGKTSAYMTKMILDHFREYEPEKRIIVMFANTGEEHEETLRFVDRCDRGFGFGVIWIEAVVDPRAGFGIRHKVVSFSTASRNGEPFESYIAKHGIPNAKYKQCTTRLKTEPMDSLRVSLGLVRGEFSTAVGSRADEIDRMSLSAMDKHNVFYPCIDAGVTRGDVDAWWATQSFNLNIPTHLGNCKWCWKKSKRKLLTLAKDYPEVFEFPHRMETQYPLAGGERRDGQPRQARTFFRGNTSALDIIHESATTNFVPFDDKNFPQRYYGDDGYSEDLDTGGACGETCEVGVEGNEDRNGYGDFDLLQQEQQQPTTGPEPEKDGE